MHTIDLHTHILPAAWPDLRERYACEGWVSIEHEHDASGACCGARLLIDGEHFRSVGTNCFDHAVRLEEMDRKGVGVQVLSTVPVMFSYWAQPQHALDLSRLLNDHIASLVRVHPSRFQGLGTVPLQDPDLAIAELQRCMDDLSLRGVQIGTHVQRPDGPDWNLSEPALLPFFEACQRLGAAVFVHPWDMMGMDQMSRYWLPWLVGMPAETSRAICSMIFGGVFDRLPSLRVCFAHGGGSFPGTIGRIEHGYACRPDLVATDCRHNPRSYLAHDGQPARIFVDSLTHSPGALRAVIDLLDERRVALGSDYPFPLGEAEPGQMIRSMADLPDSTKRRLLSGTAREFLGLETSDSLPLGGRGPEREASP